MTPLIARELETVCDREAMLRELETWGPIGRTYAVGSTLLLDEAMGSRT